MFVVSQFEDIASILTCSYSGPKFIEREKTFVWKRERIICWHLFFRMGTKRAIAATLHAGTTVAVDEKGKAVSVESNRCEGDRKLEEDSRT